MKSKIILMLVGIMFPLISTAGLTHLFDRLTGNRWMAKQEAISGTLLDSYSESPVGGAYVVMAWWGSVAHFPSSYEKCIHIQITKTDAAGAFVLPEWRITRDIIPDSLRAHWVSIRFGYEVSSSMEFHAADDKKYFLERMSGTNEDWIRSVLLKSGEASCDVSGEGAKSIHNFFSDLVQQIESIPGSDRPIIVNQMPVRAKDMLLERARLAR